MRYIAEGRDVRDVEQHRIAGFETVASAREAARWFNSGDHAADPEGFIWEETS